MLFVDSEKAFDSVDGDLFWKIFSHYGIPAKIVKMIRIFYEGFQARVLLHRGIAEPFEMKTVVPQGCLVSHLLFIVALVQIPLPDKLLVTTCSTGIQFTLL